MSPNRWAMVATSEFREYEKGVADVLASVVGESATVQRNVRLPSSSGVRPPDRLRVRWTGDEAAHWPFPRTAGGLTLTDGGV